MTTYELIIDNAKMQVHCHDTPPPIIRTCLPITFIETDNADDNNETWMNESISALSDNDDTTYVRVGTDLDSRTLFQMQFGTDDFSSMTSFTIRIKVKPISSGDLSFNSGDINTPDFEFQLRSTYGIGYPDNDGGYNYYVYILGFWPADIGETGEYSLVVDDALLAANPPGGDFDEFSTDGYPPNGSTPEGTEQGVFTVAQFAEFASRSGNSLLGYFKSDVGVTNSDGVRVDVLGITVCSD